MNFKRTMLQNMMVIVLAIAIMGFFASIAFLATPLDPVTRVFKNFSFSDIYYEILKETTPGDTSRVITIVDLTKLTNRTVIAETIHNIEDAHPKVLAVDACFDKFGEDIGGNILITDVAETYPNIVWSMKCLDYKNDSIGWTKVIHSFFVRDVNALGGTRVKEGSTNMPRGNQYDSMKRLCPLYEKVNGRLRPSLTQMTAKLYTGRDVAMGRTEDVAVNYSPVIFRKLQPEDVKMHPEYINGQIVLLGSLYEDCDFHWTPVGKIAGVELLAYAIQTLVYDRQPKDMNFFAFCLLSILMILFAQTLQSWYIAKTGGSSNFFVKYVLGSGYVLGILTFLFTSVFLGLGYILFVLTDVTFNIAWGMSVIAFLGTSRSMFDDLQKYYLARRAKKQSKT